MTSELLYNLAKPILFKLDPETAHKLSIKAMKCRFSVGEAKHNDLRLTQNLWNVIFPNPIGMAAGFDKNAECVDALLGTGFGFVEVGTVTPRPQVGNPRPRIFRDEQSRSIINAMGFPNAGALSFEENIHKFKNRGKNSAGIVGINIGKNKDTEDAAQDYVTLIQRFAGIADYLTVNISSPNTPGLRDLQKSENLKPFLQELINARAQTTAEEVPLLVKLAPDLNGEECRDIAQTLLECQVDGIILTNTTSDRPSDLPESFTSKTGGLSGPALKQKSLEILKTFYALTGGQIPIIGAGGIENGADAYAKIRAGASLVQLYTGFIYHGPAMVKQIQEELITLMQKDGFEHIIEAVGADHR